MRSSIFRSVCVIGWSQLLLLGGAAFISGCETETHHHDYDDDQRSRVVVVRDQRGWEHRGWYDRNGDWHGYYVDERSVRHDDDRGWGRNYDREWAHRPRHDDDDSNRRRDDDRDRR